MTPWSRSWMRAMKGRVQQEVHSSPALRRLRKEHRSGPRQYSGAWILRCFVVGGLATAAVLGAPFDLLIRILGGWAFSVSLFRCAQIQTLFVGSPPDPVFMLLPTPEEFVRRYRWSAIRDASIWLTADALVVLGFCGWGDALVFSGMLGLAALMGLSALGGCVVAVAAFPRFPFGALLGLLYFGFIVVTIFEKSFGSHLVFLAEFTWWCIHWFTPIGWVAEAALCLDGSRIGWSLLLLLPAAACAVAVPFARKLLPRLPDWPDGELVSGQIADPFEEDGIPVGHGMLDSGFQPSDESDEHFRERRPLDPIPWRDPLARLLLRWLDARQRHIAEFLIGPSVAWTKSLGFSMKVIVCGLALAFLASLWDRDTAEWIVLGAGGLAALISLPILGSGLDGFSKVRIGTRFACMHSLLPVGYSEMQCVARRSSVIRILAATPLFLAYGAAVCALHGDWGFLAVVAKLLAFAMAIVPIQAVFEFSSGTNDSTRLRSAVLIVTGFLIFLVFAIAATITLFVAKTWLIATLALASLAALSWLAAAAYGFLYQRNLFDHFN